MVVKKYIITSADKTQSMLEFCPLPSQGETSGQRPVLVKLVIVCLTSIMQLKQLVFAY